MKLLQAIKAARGRWKLRRRLRRSRRQVENLKKWYASGDPQQRIETLRGITKRPGETAEAHRQRIQAAILKGDIFDE